MPRSVRLFLVMLLALAFAGAAIDVAADPLEGIGGGDAIPSALPSSKPPQKKRREEPEEDEVKTPAHLEIIAMPVFGNASLPIGGWTEIIVRITNKGSEQEKGTVKIFGGLHRKNKENGNYTVAPYGAAAGATVSLRVPVRVSERDNPLLRVYNDDDDVIFEQNFPPSVDNRTLLVNVAKASVLGAALRGIPAGARNDPWAAHGYNHLASPTGTSIVEVTAPLYDTVTGDAILPRRAAGYARVAAVVMRSDELVNLPALELEALSGFVLAGGTVGIVITRPEDMRNPIVESMVGGEIEEIAVQPETLIELVLPSPPARPGGAGPAGVRPVPAAAAPEPDVKDELIGYEGGNLRPTSYGASGTYGLGEVHVLSFDPQEKPGVDSPWVHIRMVDMLRRASERTSGVLFRHGDRHTLATDVRRQLDPNESSRWAIMVTVLILVLYSIIAGPVNFTIWRRRHRPLRALVWLPITSAVAFGAVVAIGVGAKGCSGRARQLTLVEAGAGMKRATARRWRGFFVPTAREMTVRTESASSVVGVETMRSGDSIDDTLRVDRDGLRLEGLALRPWETLVVREDGYSDLGGGISIFQVDDKELKVKNKTGKRLRGLILSCPWGEMRYLNKLDDNSSASSKRFRPVSRVAANVRSPLPVRDFKMYALTSRLERTSEGLTDAWQAVVESIHGVKNWFPADVPVLLAEMEASEEQKRDTGLLIDSERVLVRVVGYGGI